MVRKQITVLVFIFVSLSFLVTDIAFSQSKSKTGETKTTKTDEKINGLLKKL